ncbi:MAG: DeoR/GlpR family DNA-binding transcription regulator [Pelolinea sp.]|nr:DeoR/GlpR family DNA-binding transcription regulator [Pelolinea sp.]
MVNSDIRRSEINDRIEKKGSVSISELAVNFKVSDMTIRRDLIKLEKMSIIRRVHGGAVAFYGRSFEPPLISRSNKNISIKQLIGRYAAKMVVDGDSIAMDVGSTTMEMAMNLIGRQNLTIVTPNLHIANLLGDESQIRVIVAGGIVRRGEKSLIGDLAYYTFREVNVDKLFLGTGGIDSKAGLTEHDMQDAQVRKEMIRCAKEVVLLTDSSKFQQIAFAYFADFSQIDHLVCEKEPSDELLMALKAANVVIHIVNSESEYIM